MYEIFMQLMKSKKLSAYKVSKDTGITQATLSRWKNGKVSPSLETLQILADYFCVSLDYLTGKTTETTSVVPSESNKKELPTAKNSEEFDIATELEEMMQKLESDGSLMFDGNPASPEAVRSIRTALEMGLRYAREVEKEKNE